jgi:hypothetical protein
MLWIGVEHVEGEKHEEEQTPIRGRRPFAPKISLNLAYAPGPAVFALFASEAYLVLGM